MEAKEIVRYLRKNTEFRGFSAHARNVIIFDKKENRIGYMWFKHLLGGWRIAFDNDIRPESNYAPVEDFAWCKRGTMDSFEKIKIELESYEHTKN